jgi:hypothetical protein
MLYVMGSATLEDKIVQRAVVEVLNAIYEEDFLGFSYGFRPGRSPHDALDALTVGIERKKVNYEEIPTAGAPEEEKPHEARSRIASQAEFRPLLSQSARR